MLLPAVRAVLPILGLAADELAEELIALVAQLLVNAGRRRVVTADRRFLGHHEKRLERRPRRLLVMTDALEDCVDVIGTQPAERRVETQHRFGIQRRQAAYPLQRQLAVVFAQQKIDVIGHARLLCARRSIVGGNHRLYETLEGLELWRREHLEFWRAVGLLDAGEREQPSIGQPRQRRNRADAGADGFE